MTLRFDDRVAIVTGAAAGLGRSHATTLASRGARVLVNDLQNADAVVDEIQAAGGQAIACEASVEDGARIVAAATEGFGRLDIVVNNAGVLRDRSFAKMTAEDWDVVHRVHLFGAFAVTRAAWPHLQAQGYGRIVSTASPAVYGNFGQANYTAAKAGLIGLTRTLAVEGRAHDIRANAIAPLAGSSMLRTVLPDEICKQLDPEFVSACVMALCSDQTSESGSLFEVAGGWIAKVREQRSHGVVLGDKDGRDPDAVVAAWNEIVNFEELPDDPEATPTTLGSLRLALRAIGYDTDGLDFSRGLNLGGPKPTD